MKKLTMVTMVTLSMTAGTLLGNASLAATTKMAKAAKTEVKTFAMASMAKLEVENDSGEITIVRAAEGIKEVGVTATKKKFDENKCELIIEQKGSDKLFVSAGDKKGSDHADCVVNVVVQVAADLRPEIEIKNGSGNVSLKDIEAKELAVKLGSGNLKVMGRGLDTNDQDDLQFDIMTGSGNVALDFSKMKMMQKGEIEIKTGSGNASIKLPKDNTCVIDSMIGSGSLKNTLCVTDSAPLKIKAKIGSGNLQVE